MSKKRKDIQANEFFSAKKQKPNEMKFSVHDKSLVKASYKCDEMADCTVAVAAFDLDSTLTIPITPGPFMRHADDWRWLYKTTTQDLKQIASKGTHGKLISKQKYLVVIFTNQGGCAADDKYKRYQWFKARIRAMSEQLDIPFRVYAAAKVPKGTPSNVEDKYRKPKIGMWDELEQDLGKQNVTINKESSFYVGDAAGRKQDHSDADIEFAKNVSLTFYTPEEFFEQDKI